ncbi:MAG: hypothetical protein Q8M12_06400, partial [bacterium]|nr:hypothetical protein [bacterium]
MFFLLVVVGLVFSKNIYAACVAGSPCTLANPVNGSLIGKCTPEGACFPVTTGSVASELTPTDEAVNDFLQSAYPSSGSNTSETPINPGSQPVTTPINPGSKSVTTADGVYIPTAAETGLSDRGIKALLTSLLRWLLGIVGVIA